MNSDKIKELIKDNSNYWERRALENKLNIIENEEDYIKRISAIYDKANRDIDDKLAAVYTRYAKENGLTLNEAYQMLPRKMETEYKKDVMDYIEKAKSGDGKWKQYLLNQSLMHKHSVLDQLRTEMRNVIYNIDIETSGGKFLEKIYANANYYEQFADNNEQFAKIDQDKVKRLLQEDWSGGGNFSDSIWKDKEKLVNALDDIVIRGLATGESYDKMADKLAKRMETSKSNAKRLIMTESARMDNEGLLAYYKETKVKNLIFVATLDTRTSEICQAMDQQIIPIEEAQIGLNVPPMHPYCRSVISPYYEGNEPETRAYRDVVSDKTEVGTYKDYVDYLGNHLGNKEQAEALASKRNTIANLIKAINTFGPGEITGQSNGTIEINPDEELIQKNDRDWNRYKEAHADEFTEEMEKQVEEDLKKLLEENDMAIRGSMNALEQIIEDGRIKSRFETGSSTTIAPEQYRLEGELKLFGYQYNLDPKLRPLYGYLTNFSNGFDGSSSNSAIAYGNVSIKLKKNNLKNITTFTVGDSLDATMYDVKVPSLYTNPSIKAVSPHRSLTDKYGNYTGKLGSTIKEINENVRYFELQFHNQITIDDIEKVYIYKSFDTWEGRKSFGVSDEEIEKLTKALDKANIDYEVVE